jgi:hypothetical protein
LLFDIRYLPDDLKIQHPASLAPGEPNANLERSRHEILLPPYYGVFDVLSYKVDPDGTVTLAGFVTRPTLKSDAENVIKKIKGVEKVDNQITVLPLSPNDDRICRAAFREIYGFPSLNKYGRGNRFHHREQRGHHDGGPGRYLHRQEHCGSSGQAVFPALS